MGIKDRLKAIGPEIAATLSEKVIPQGAAELAGALNTGSAYVPYGPAQKPLEASQEVDPQLAQYAAQSKQMEPEPEKQVELE